MVDSFSLKRLQPSRAANSTSSCGVVDEFEFSSLLLLLLTLTSMLLEESCRPRPCFFSFSAISSSLLCCFAVSIVLIRSLRLKLAADNSAAVHSSMLVASMLHDGSRVILALVVLVVVDVVVEVVVVVFSIFRFSLFFLLL